MDELSAYFVGSDHYLLLFSEKIYLEFFFDEIGVMSKKEQISSLISKLGDSDMNFPFLCSIFYLLTEHEVISYKNSKKRLKITLVPNLINSTTSLAVIDLCVQFLTAEIPKEEEMIHFRTKVVLDLIVTLIFGHMEDIQY